MRLPHKGRALTIASIAAAAVLVVSGIAVATIPDGDGLIHGCYAKKGGSVKVIDTDKRQACPSGYLPLNWNQQGIPGAGGQSPVEIATWNFSHTNNDDEFVILSTQQGIAEGDKVMGLDATLTGMEGCYSGGVQVGMPDRKDPGINSGVLAQWGVSDGAIVTSDADALDGTEWVQGPNITVWPGLRAVLSCRDADGNPLVIPDVEGSVTFRWTHVPPQVEIQ